MDTLWTDVGHKGEKGGYEEGQERGTCWRGTTLDIDSRLRVGQAIGKTR